MKRKSLRQRMVGREYPKALCTDKKTTADWYRDDWWKLRRYTEDWWVLRPGEVNYYDVPKVTACMECGMHQKPGFESCACGSRGFSTGAVCPVCGGPLSRRAPPPLLSWPKKGVPREHEWVVWESWEPAWCVSCRKLEPVVDEVRRWLEGRKRRRKFARGMRRVASLLDQIEKMVCAAGAPEAIRAAAW